MDINRFKQLPIMGILRGIDEEMITPIVEVAQSAGLETIEVTMNTPGASELIKKMVRIAQGRLTVGAGTVLTLEDLHRALDAGATFIVLPTLVDEVIEDCVRHHIPVFPGALTPNEIIHAWRAGAAMVKVFPAKFFGPEYFKEIKGPFQDVELLACGGVNHESISSFFACGASGAAFGGSIFKKEWLKQRDYSRIEGSLKKLIQGYLDWEKDPV